MAEGNSEPTIDEVAEALNASGPGPIVAGSELSESAVFGVLFVEWTKPALENEGLENIATLENFMYRMPPTEFGDGLYLTKSEPNDYATANMIDHRNKLLGVHKFDKDEYKEQGTIFLAEKNSLDIRHTAACELFKMLTPIYKGLRANYTDQQLLIGPKPT